MPEGDTIHAYARTLGPALVGRALTLLEVDQRVVPWGAGAVVTACDAVGKHLVVRLEVGGAADPAAPFARASDPAAPFARAVRYLRVHLGMKGSWHRYRPGEAWARSPHGRRVVIASDEALFVCFSPKEVELGLFAEVRHLGPDLLAEAPDLAAVVTRARAADRALGELLLAQTVASGIGNVYKSETLFLEGLDPWRPASTLSDARLEAVFSRARALMRDNLERGGWRTTTPRGPGTTPREHRFWVYRRAGRPCRRCGRPVLSRLQGGRMTYWCPGCQS